MFCPQWELGMLLFWEDWLEENNRVRGRNIPSSVLIPTRGHQPREGLETRPRCGCDHKGAVAPRDAIPPPGVSSIEASLETRLGEKRLQVPAPHPLSDLALPLGGTSAFGT